MTIQDKLNKALNDYVDQFDAAYPAFCLQQMSAEDIIKDIQNCLAVGKPKTVEISTDIVY